MVPSLKNIAETVLKNRTDSSGIPYSSPLLFGSPGRLVLAVGMMFLPVGSVTVSQVVWSIRIIMTWLSSSCIWVMYMCVMY